MPPSPTIHSHNKDKKFPNQSSGIFLLSTAAAVAGASGNIVWAAKLYIDRSQPGNKKKKVKADKPCHQSRRKNVSRKYGAVKDYKASFRGANRSRKR